jgi:hypothetical protein
MVAVPRNHYLQRPLTGGFFFRCNGGVDEYRFLYRKRDCRDAAAYLYLALRPANVPISEHAASICDVPELYILENRCAIYELARPNRRAGWLAIVAAVLGAASALSPVFWQ